MTKIPHCKGSYNSRRNGTSWQLQYPLGPEFNYKSYHEDFQTEAEAIAALKDINDFIYHGGTTAGIEAHRGKDASKKAIPTVAEFVDTFCQLRKDQGIVEKRTCQGDWTELRRVLPYIGNMLVTAVTPADIEAMYASMKVGGKTIIETKRYKGETKQVETISKPYSGTTIQKTHGTLSLLFDKAVKYRYITSNPCGDVEKPKRDTKEKEALSVKDASELASHIAKLEKPHPNDIGVAISLFTGARLSEMLALNWEDYSKGALLICKSQEKDSQETKGTKNGENRLIPCPDGLIDILQKWQPIQKAWYKSEGLKWSEHCPIVNSTTGTHVLQSVYERWFNEARKKYPIPNGFTFHSLRHTYVTLMRRDCGIDDRTAQSLSGHKSTQAFEIYSHTNDAWQKEAAVRYGSLISPDDGEKRCRNCAHWAASPDDHTVGACWAKAKDKIIFIAEGASFCTLEKEAS